MINALSANILSTIIRKQEITIYSFLVVSIQFTNNLVSIYIVFIPDLTLLIITVIMIIKTKFIFILILGLTYGKWVTLIEKHSVNNIVFTARTGFGPGEQEWGFVEVRDNAHIFYWLYLTTAAVNNVTEKPLVIWLQGGPGASSTGYGNFAELGNYSYK